MMQEFIDCNGLLTGDTVNFPEADLWTEPALKKTHRHPAVSFALGEHLIKDCGNAMLFCSNQSLDVSS